MRVLGVDGGQSSTRCLVVDEHGTVVGHATAGPSNHVHGEEGRTRLRLALRDSILGALPEAVPPVSVDGIVLGMTGIGKTLGRPALVEGYVREFVTPTAMEVHNDLMIVLMGASGTKPGIVVYAGTGAHTFGINAKGDHVRVGGWGHIIDDEGAGYDIGRRGIQSVFRSHDGRGPRTELQADLLELFGCETIEDLRNRIYQDPEFGRAGIAAASRAVDRASERGDAVATSILQQAGYTLARTAVAALERLENDGSCAVYYAGGVFRSKVLRRTFVDSVMSQRPDAGISPPRFSPVVGAILMAYQLLGLDLNPALLDRLAREVKRIGWDT